MAERPRKLDAPQFLSGWKEIANYLGKGVRTVQRYELQLALPVRRPAGRPWGSVVATKAELDAWVKASPIREVFRVSFAQSQNEDPAWAEEIRRGVARLVELRDQMFELRMEVHESVRELKNTVCALQGELMQNQDSGFAEAKLQHEERERLLARDEFELLMTPQKHRKAS